MRISSLFSAFLFLVLSSAAGFGQPPGPPPHDMEPPEGVPPSLLELAGQMSAVRQSLSATREELHDSIKKEGGGGWSIGGKPGQMRRNHKTIRQIQDLRGKAGRIAREAWDTVRQLGEAREEGGAPPLPPERRKELEHWMMDTFGPPPQDNGPFPWKNEHMDGEHPWFPGFQGKMLFEKIDRMEKRIEELEGRIQAQEDEIQRLRQALGGRETQPGGGGE
jgi:hypothetical protein